MRPVVWIAIALIALGIAAWGYQGVIWVRGKERVAEIGPIKVEREKDFPVPMAPIIGGVALVGGILLLATRSRETT